MPFNCSRRKSVKSCEPQERRERMSKSSLNPSHILRVECQDKVGLVHQITGVLYRSGLNIVQNDEFVDREHGKFFMRTEFSGTPNVSRILRELRTKLPKAARLELSPSRKKDIVILATREAHCLGDLLIRHAYGEIPARILAVVSNHDFLNPLVKKFGIPYHVVTYQGQSKANAERTLLQILRNYSPEYIVLAKFMRILSRPFVVKYPNRIINIHHSFLPAFIGKDPYQQASKRGVKIIGATAHFVTADLDQGPIIAQGTVAVDHSHSVEDMTQAGRDIEKTILAKTLKLAFEDRIFVCGNKTIIFD